MLFEYILERYYYYKFVLFCFYRAITGFNDFKKRKVNGLTLIEGRQMFIGLVSTEYDMKADFHVTKRANASELLRDTKPINF